jgi:hypothetical protein
MTSDARRSNGEPPRNLRQKVRTSEISYGPSLASIPRMTIYNHLMDRHKRWIMKGLARNVFYGVPSLNNND